MRSKKLIIIVAVVLFAIMGGSLFYLSTGIMPAMQEAVEAAKSDQQVGVIIHGNITFSPKNKNTDTGVIIYPGAKVDPLAYAPAAKALAERGIKAVIVKMPFHMAILGGNKATAVIAEDSNIKHWYIAGHSLGGVMAAKYAKNNEDKVAGLILWASYPMDSSDLSASGLPVLSIYGTNDGLVLPGKISDTQKLLPPDVTWYSINGGNHGQFGWYGIQKGDQPAGISREEQQQEIITAIMDFIKPNAFGF